MNEPYFVGIDIGTSAVKTILVDSNQRIIGESTNVLGISRPRPLWAEQDPEDWWTAVKTGLADLSKSYPLEYGKVVSIGLSGQMHGAVLLDGSGNPLRPAILWNDGRSHEQAQAFHTEFPHLAEELGVLPMPGFTAPKIKWIAENEPDVFERISCVLLAKDYIRFKLTGELKTDMSDAAGSWFLDQAGRRWSDRACKAAGLDIKQLPTLVEGSDISGSIFPSTAQEIGLKKDVLVAGGGGDSPVGSVGTGLVSEGTGMINLGTSALMLIPTSSYRPAVDALIHSFCHALPGMWYQMAAMLNGASAFGWAANLTGQKVEALSAQIEQEYTGPGELIFLPYLAGERTPHNNPHAKGVFFGLTPGSDPVQIGQAVMEGVACTFADAKDCLKKSGTTVPALSIMGGGARSRIWCQIIADVLNRPIIRHKGGDLGPSFGAARLARLAFTKENPLDVCTAPEVDEIIEPSSIADEYAPRIKKFRRLYQILAEEFE